MIVTFEFQVKQLFRLKLSAVNTFSHLTSCRKLYFSPLFRTAFYLLYVQSIKLHVNITESIGSVQDNQRIFSVKL